jgi:methylglyoxal reductase
MRFRQIGGSGIQASTVALGAWAIGGWMWGGQDDRESIRTVHAALDQGVDFIDTAPIYGFGRSEEVVGRAIAGRRDQVVLATKCGLLWEGAEPRKGRYHFSADEKGLVDRERARFHVYRYLGGASIREELEGSLRRLGVETIDLYQTHWQESTTSIEETMETLLRLKEEGKIRAIGVSNASLDQLTTYCGVGRVDADQERYSMLDRELESTNIPFCHEKGIAFLAYSPLANGLLTGKIDPDRRFAEGDLRRSSPRFSGENLPKARRLLERIQSVADGRGATPAQIVIAWTIARPGVTHALVGARTEEQAVANAKAADVILSRTELDEIATALEAYGTDVG